MTSEILNVLIAGTGGQGVIYLSNLIRELARKKGYHCEGASYKGGAQRMGSVHTELRIDTSATNGLLYSSQIGKGEVQVFIGLEPWETLRFAPMCNENTKLIVNSQEQTLFTMRKNDKEVVDPIQTIKHTFKRLKLKNYSQEAKQLLGDKKFATKLVLEDAIEMGYLPFDQSDLDELMIDEHGG